MINRYRPDSPVSLFAVLLAVTLLAGCAGTQTVDGEVNPDPYEDTNRSFYAFNDYLDRNIMIPVAENYKKVTPEPVRDGITNFFDNLEYLNVILHSFLQGKTRPGLQRPDPFCGQFHDRARRPVRRGHGHGTGGT